MNARVLKQIAMLGGAEAEAEVLQKSAKEAKPRTRDEDEGRGNKILGLPGAPLRQDLMEEVLAEAGADDRLLKRLAALADFARVLDGRANAASLRLSQMSGEFRSARATERMARGPAVLAAARRTVRELEFEAQAMMKAVLVYRELAGELRGLL